MRFNDVSTFQPPLPAFDLGGLDGWLALGEHCVAYDHFAESIVPTLVSVNAARTRLTMVSVENWDAERLSDILHGLGAYLYYTPVSAPAEESEAYPLRWDLLLVAVLRGQASSRMVRLEVADESGWDFPTLSRLGPPEPAFAAHRHPYSALLHGAATPLH